MSLIFESSEGFTHFTMLITYYLDRKLIYSTDILRAYRGLIRKISFDMGVHFIEGNKRDYPRLWANHYYLLQEGSIMTNLLRDEKASIVIRGLAGITPLNRN